MIKNIAVKGGGIKGIAYVGALKVLEDNQQLEHVQRVSGTSAGALLAGMMSVGFSADEIKELMLSLDFKKFEGGWNPIRIFTKYGLYTGDYILDFIHKFLAKSKYKFSKNVTFNEMRDAGCKDLFVFTCNVNSQSVV